MGRCDCYDSCRYTVLQVDFSLYVIYIHCSASQFHFICNINQIRKSRGLCICLVLFLALLKGTKEYSILVVNIFENTGSSQSNLYVIVVLGIEVVERWASKAVLNHTHLL